MFTRKQNIAVTLNNTMMIKRLINIYKYLFQGQVLEKKVAGNSAFSRDRNQVNRQFKGGYLIHKKSKVSTEQLSFLYGLE